MAEPLLTEVAIFINKDAPAGEVSKHFASHSGRHVEVVHFGRVHILPVRHEADPVWKNRWLHELNLVPQNGFALGRRALNRIGDVVAEGLVLRWTRDCHEEHEERDQPDCQFHAPPPGWRRIWGRLRGSSMDADLIAA